MILRSASLRRIAALDLWLIVTALLAASVPASAQGLTGASVSVGADYTVGKYGSATDTKILSVPVTGKYEIGPWGFELTLSYLRIDGPGDVVGGDGVIVTRKGKNQGNNTATVNSGFGDVIAGVRYTVLSGPALPTIDLIGKVKIPTADETKNLGTGEFDYTVRVDVAQRLGRFIPYGSIGYRFIGDPAGIDLNNQVLLNAGTSLELSHDFFAGVSFDYRTSTTDGAENPAEISPYFTWKFAPTLKMNVYSVIGLSNGSPDYGGGLQLVVAP